MGFFSLFSSSKTVKDIGFTDKKLTPRTELDRDFFKDIIDNLDSLMLYYFQGEGWIGANRTFLEKMNLKDISEFQKQHESIRDLFISESEEIFTESDKSWLDYIRKYQKNGYRVVLRTDNGEILQINARCYLASKNKNFYTLELQDVTALHNAEIKTEEVESLKRKFLANIGHEFRTPMNGILGFIELIQETKLDKQQKEYVDMVHNSSKNLMSNIEILLDLSQLQGGRLEVSRSEFNILPEMEKLAYHFCVAGYEKGIKVLSFIDPKLPHILVGDLKKIRQIMFSIVQNAIKFTPKGGKVILEVKLLKRQKNGDCSIGFGVKDSGKGISAEQLLHIDEPFTSGNQADERLGVGLALSNGLVNLLGSKLKIHSKEKEGTYINFVLNFNESQGQNYKMMPKKKVKVLLLDQSRVDEANFLTIYLRAFAIDVIKSNQLDANVYEGIDALYIVANQKNAEWILKLGAYKKRVPVMILLDKNEKLQTRLATFIDKIVRKPLLPSYMAKHLYASNKMQTQELAVTKLNIGKRVSALVVEDNLINQRLIKIILENYNIDVTTASNGVEGVHSCSKYKYDIIFMDIDMPEKNGIDATKEIKESMGLNKITPIVALTAMAMEGDREYLIKNGLDNYLEKPLTLEKLEFILNKYLKGSI